MEILKIIKEILPYVVSIVSAIFVYLKTTKEYKIDLEKIQKNHENDLEKLMKQHEIDIENVKEKHKLEMESKEKDHIHELELLKLKSETTIDEKTKETENTALYGIMSDVFKDILTGKISKAQLDKLQKDFPKNN